MTIKHFERSQLHFGIFFDKDYSYSNKRGDFFNLLKRNFNNRNLVLISDPRVGDNMIDENFNVFRITPSDSSLHFENNCSKIDFLKDCETILSLYQSIFQNEIIKIGFIYHFGIPSRNKDYDYLRNLFFKPFPSYTIPVIDFHLTFKKDIQNIEYNFNFTMSQEIILENVNGSLDMNLSRSEDKSLKPDDVKLILDVLDNYYHHEFINDFFNKDGK